MRNLSVKHLSDLLKDFGQEEGNETAVVIVNRFGQPGHTLYVHPGATVETTDYSKQDLVQLNYLSSTAWVDYAGSRCRDVIIEGERVTICF